jgi:hypothetical protein
MAIALPVVLTTNKVDQLFLKGLKTGLASHIINGYAGMCIPEIRLRHGPKSLLARCVPDLHLYYFVVDFYCFYFEVYADCL